jgi:acyl carrier protein
MSVRAQIAATIAQVARDQRKQLLPITDDLSLIDSGLDSLCLAIIVARLEDILSIDPFSEEEVTEFPTTIGDLIRLYENAAA